DLTLASRPGPTSSTQLASVSADTDSGLPIAPRMSVTHGASTNRNDRITDMLTPVHEHRTYKKRCLQHTINRKIDRCIVSSLHLLKRETCVARALAARGIATARGGAWTPVQVSTFYAGVDGDRGWPGVN